jgi:uncharacterized phosphosugar-binding protein
MQSSIYWDSVLRIMHQIRAQETDAIERSAQLCADTIAGGGVIHTFGTGTVRSALRKPSSGRAASPA